MAIDNQVVNADAPKRFIEMVQRQLIRENPSALPSHGVDGSYGPETTDWVERFQERKGLQVDGIAGPETLQRFRADIVLRPNTNGRGIEILQEDLLYFFIQQSVVDGSYGPGTTQGVRDFQFLNNMIVDGTAGPNTLKRMDELLTKLYVTEGDTGSLVRRIQTHLNEQDTVDISIEVDGSYGPATKQAVEDYQEENDLFVDGVVGPRTMYLLNAENSALLTDVETEEALNEIGLTFTDSSDEMIDKFTDLFRNHPEVQKVLGDDEFGEIAVTEMDFDGTEDNEIVMVIADVKEKANLMYAGQFFKTSEKLEFFTVQDVFGNLPDDDVEVTTYQISDDGVTIESSSSTNVDLEDNNVQAQAAFRDAVMGSNATGAQLAMVGCGGTLIVAANSDKITIQGWDDVVGISCNFVIDVSALFVSKAIVSAFPAIAGGLATAIPIISALIVAVGAWFFCNWLADQV